MFPMTFYPRQNRHTNEYIACIIVPLLAHRVAAKEEEL
jgi:hypothetical protein